MPTVKSVDTAARIVTPEASFESIEVVQPAVPSLRIKLTDADDATVITEGMPGVTAVALDWTDFIPVIIDLGKKLLSDGGGGSGGGGGKCTTIKVTQKDGTTDTVTHC